MERIAGTRLILQEAFRDLAALHFSRQRAVRYMHQQQRDIGGNRPLQSLPRVQRPLERRCRQRIRDFRRAGGRRIRGLVHWATQELQRQEGLGQPVQVGQECKR